MTEIETNKNQNEESTASRKQLTNKKILAFSLEFGFMIVLPLLIFTFVGKWLSERYDNMIYFYGGVVLALLTSTVWFWKKINDIYRDFMN